MVKEEDELKLKNLIYLVISIIQIYVIGTGIISSKDNNKTYRDPKILGSLKNFWTKYFEKSNGNLIEMGQPSLKNEIE